MLGLFQEYFSLINLTVVDNSDSMLVVVSLLDQISIKTLILCEDLHPLLRVQMVGALITQLRLYTQSYVFLLANPNSSKFEQEKVLTKLVDIIGFINDQVLAKFQFSLVFLLDYGQAKEIPKKELCDCIEELMKNSFFGFEYQGDRNPNNRKKPSQLAEVVHHLTN